MIFEKYDWYDDRVAFLKIDQMRNNLWDKAGDLIWVPQANIDSSANLENIKINITNSIRNKFKND